MPVLYKSVLLAHILVLLKSQFTYIYPIVPAPVIFLALGTILLASNLLPRVFGLGIAFAAVGLIALFTTTLLTIIVLSLQALWVLAAALTLLFRAGPMFDARGEAGSST